MEQQTSYIYADILNLSSSLIGTNVHITGRIHKVRKSGGLCFLVLRYQQKTIQCICKRADIGKDKFTELVTFRPETIVQLYGKLSLLPANIGQVDSTYYKDMEFVVCDYNLISKTQELPFVLIDADSKEEEDFRSNVLVETRQKNRWLDLRVPTNNCIFKLRSALVNYFRIFLLENDFTEIQTPKLLGTASESGASVFKLKYFSETENACLAQSPQLYKQMAICADFDRVFEIGPVFRAENSISFRHLCEFTGLDLEVSLNPNEKGEVDYKQVTDLIWKLLKYIHTRLYEGKKEEIEYIRERFPFTDLVIPVEPVYFQYKDAVLLLNENGMNMKDTDDLSTPAEKLLGDLIKQITGSDMFILTGYPSNVRPFYTMLDPIDNRFSNSYDIILNGTEISSGAQRIHQYDELCKRVSECGINPASLYGYLDSFKYGCKPHAGCGLGLERLLMLFFGLKNVRQTSFCPRDPNILTP